MKNKIIIISIFLAILIISNFIFLKHFYDTDYKKARANVLEYDKSKDELNEIVYQLNEENEKKDNIKRTFDEKTKKKEELEKTLSEKQSLSGKIVYLTFDDGPSEYTMDILNTLDKYNAKATFFVTCSDKLSKISKEIVKRGHTIALHTCTHRYKDIYKSEEAYFKDLNAVSDKVFESTNVRSKYVRFPGGSSNTVSRFNKGIITRLSGKLTNRGYKYYDWNVDSNDAAGANKEQVYANVMESLQMNNKNVYTVLMHDTKIATRDALDSIIKDVLDMGYTFSNINDYSPTVHHLINN